MRDLEFHHNLASSIYPQLLSHTSIYNSIQLQLGLTFALLSFYTSSLVILELVRRVCGDMFSYSLDQTSQASFHFICLLIV